ncbi:MAG: LptF/LptG family permease [Spirosomaceae bacterium]|jgi:lipopolysaccharide export system permease protein|nr:LptF/LptG family permease [Spirosomataceae bacterium]
MKLLDRYILKNFLVTYIFTVAITMLIICVIDFTEKIDNFRKFKVGTQEILVDYYANLIPYYANYLSPLLVFIATVFFTARMAARTEIIAMFGSGISFVRMLVPYFIGSIMLAAFTFYMVGWVIPKANKTRLAFEYKYIDDQYYFNKRNFHVKVAPQLYAYIESYNNASNTGYKFTLEKIEGNNLREKLTSDRIEWQAKKKKWAVFDYKIRKINGLQESFVQGTQLDTTLNLSPKDFENDKNRFEELTLTQLNDYIALLNLRGADGVEAYQIEKYTRFTHPFAFIILTIIGVIVSARKSRRGSGLQIAFGFALAFVYLLFFMLAKGIAESGRIPAVLAVWLPNLIFSAIGFVLYKTLPR